jgi:2-polyprenyl-3-methyl-5-hydroxy-6-metoxy-1,4-benzoquinol methylase
MQICHISPNHSLSVGHLRDTSVNQGLDPHRSLSYIRAKQETLLPQDKSNGYEQVAGRFISSRNSRTGAAIIREWSRTLQPRSAILDLGCGHGVPISQTLIEEGFTVFGVDGSRTLIEAYRKRFPLAFVECAGVEDSEFFQRTFNGVVACGLMFLMPEDTQSLVIHKVAAALNANGRFLFTSPKEIVTWRDTLTGRESRSLGAKRYREILIAERLDLVGERLDEGGNYYYLASKR